MSCTVCTLRPMANGWVAEYADTRQGPYQSKGVAFRVAATEALMLHRCGQPVRISMQEANGEISAEFCLCEKFKFASQIFAALKASE